MSGIDEKTDRPTENDFKIEFEYKKAELSGPKEFFSKILGKLKKSEVVSIGEAHNENSDKSYAWILKYEQEIVNAYNWYHSIQNAPGGDKKLPRLDQILAPNSTLEEELGSQGANNTFEALRKMHTGRLFANVILPSAKILGYTDVVLEGFDESSPNTSLSRSKDKIGDLLKITSAMTLGMRIHGAYAGSLLDTAAGVAESLISKTKSIKEKYKDAKFIVYNGAIHNMTDAISNTTVKEGLAEYKASDLSYAPEAIALWGDKYGSINVFNEDAKLPESHFSVMQKDVSRGIITEFSHGVDQQTYFI